MITQTDIEEKLMSDELAEKIADTLLCQISVPIKNLLSDLPDMTEEEMETKKETISKAIGKYIAESISQADLSGVIVEKAPGIIKAKLNHPMLGMFLTDELLQSILAPVGTEIQTYIAEHGEEFITPYVSEKLSDLENDSLIDIMEQMSIDKNQLKKMIMALYKKAISNCTKDLMEWLDLSSIVENKINAMNNEELEALVMSVMKKELNMIVNLGALIGLILGLLNIIF